MKLYVTAWLLLAGFSFSAYGQIKHVTPSKQVAPVQQLIEPEKPSAISSNRPAVEAKASNSLIPEVSTRPTGLITLHWNKPFTENYEKEGASIQYLSFTGALYDPKAHDLPEYNRSIKLNPGTNHVSITLVNPVYVPLSSAEINVIKQNGKYILPDVALNY
jgi:hypothetical protein